MSAGCTGLDDYLNLILACFRATMTDDGQSNGGGGGGRKWSVFVNVNDDDDDDPRRDPGANDFGFGRRSRSNSRSSVHYVVSSLPKENSASGR